MNCPNCGGDNAPHATTCSYCNGHLEPSVAPAGAGAAGPPPDPFAVVKASDAYVQRNAPARHARLPRLPALHKAMTTGVLIAFIAISAVIAITALMMGGVSGFLGVRRAGAAGGLVSIVPVLMAIVPIGFVVLGIFGLRHTRRKMARMETAPVEAVAVVVADKRTHVDGGSGESSATTTYFATVEAEDGQRREVMLWDGRLYGRLAPDDAGVLFMRDGYGLDFDRVAMPSAAKAT